MLDLLRQHAVRRARGGSSFYVGMIDFDHFKQVNDSHGHAVGDEMLHTAVPRLRVAFSSGFARYEPGEPVEQSIERADRALYAAKAAGRNRTVVL